MTEGICDFALQLPGPEAKTGYDYGRLHKTHDKTGVTIHTAEYDVADWDERVLYNALFSGRIASWHFTITKEGWLFQHYPVNAVTWHCGYDGNLWTVGIELEGYAPNKISGPQYQLLVKLLKWIREDRGWVDAWHKGSALNDWKMLVARGKEPADSALWEHKDWMATLCQVFTRGMIDADQLVRDLKEEPMEIQDDFVELRAEEMVYTEIAQTAHALTVKRQLRTISAIRHSKHESTAKEMEWWEALSHTYELEVAAIREAQERCRVHGRPG